MRTAAKHNSDVARVENKKRCHVDVCRKKATTEYTGRLRLATGYVLTVHYLCDKHEKELDKIFGSAPLVTP